MMRRDTSPAAGWRRLDEVLATLRPPVSQTQPAPPREPAARPTFPPIAPRPAPVG